MLSDVRSAARRRLDPIGVIPAFIKALSPFGVVVVAGSKATLWLLSVVASLFVRKELEKARIIFVEWHDTWELCKHRVNGLAAF